MDNKMVVLNHDGEAICSIPFGLDTSEDMIADDDIKPCTEEDLLSLTMTMPLEEGQVAALPLVPIVWGGTAILGCVIGYIGARTPEAQPLQGRANSQENLITFLVSGTVLGLGIDIANDLVREYGLLNRAKERIKLPNRSQFQNDRLLSGLSRRFSRRTPIDGLLASRFRMTITGTLSAGVCYGVRSYWR